MVVSDWRDWRRATSPVELLPHSTSDQMDALQPLSQAISGLVPVGLGLERCLHPGHSVILSLFALFNAVSPRLRSRKGAGQSRRPGSSARPAHWQAGRYHSRELDRGPIRARGDASGVNWSQIHGSANRAGVGFTTSLFASDLAIGSEQLIGFLKPVSSRARLLAPRLVTTVCGRR